MERKIVRGHYIGKRVGDMSLEELLDLILELENGATAYFADTFIRGKKR